MISTVDDSKTVVEPTFLSLGLTEKVQAAVDEQGYTIPTAIQAQTIPHLLEGRDVLGQASTGTGKTAAFALPLLSRLDLESRATQVLVLAPTRELAIQVAASFANYGKHIPGLNVQPIYGGAPFYNQMKELKRGVQVVVGTPGRVMDHMRRGTMNLEQLRCLVLDEADEMLRMGFVDDVKWILEQTPAERQCALFSATMPDPIRRIANEHLKNPATITIRSATSTSSTIRPRYLLTSHREKTSALIRILETEVTDGVIVFVKTRETTLRVADELTERGFSATAINGDIVQKQREHTIDQLRSGKLDILVATDVAARGLDVQRISHVINYDLPHDSEAWIHRIGRTGRAGRAGEAILLLTHHERRHLRTIERDTRQPIAEMQFPSAAAVNARRKADLKQKITAALNSPMLSEFRSVLSELQQESGAAIEDLAAAVGVLMQGDRPFLLEESRHSERDSSRTQHADPRTGRGRVNIERNPDARPPRQGGFRVAAVGPAEAEPMVFVHRQEKPRPRRPEGKAEAGMETYRVEVGHEHGVKPGNIVGAIANESGLDSKNIGRIDIREDHSLVDLPQGMPMDIFRGLKDVIVMGRHLRISRSSDHRGPAPAHRGARNDRRPSSLPPGSRKPHLKSGPRRNDVSVSGAGSVGESAAEVSSRRPGRIKGRKPKAASNAR